MFLNKNRVLNYIISLFLLCLLIINLPITQPVKYIFFILASFSFIIFENKKKFFSFKYFFSILIFFIIIILLNLLPIKYEIKINGFGDKDISKLNTKEKIFFEKNFKQCIFENCYDLDNYNLKIKNKFYRTHLNISNLNELRSNLFTSPGNIMKYNSMYIDKYNYPFYININFPKFYNNSKLCYVLKEEYSCFLINNNNNQFNIIGKGEKFSINLIHSFKITIINKFLTFILIFIFIILIKNHYNFRIREKFELLYPCSLIFWLIIFSLTNIENINFLNSYFFQYPGGDGYKYLILANVMSQHLRDFEIINFLKGGADVFYFMPGMRYFVALEKILFGNAYFLHLIIFSFLPFIMRNFLNIFMKKNIANLLMFSFLLFPLMHHMGFSYFQFLRYSSKVFAEPIAYTLFFFGLVRIINFYTNNSKYFSSLPFTCLVLNISCILRPNLAASAFFLLLFPLLYLIIKKEFKILFYFMFSGLVIFLPLLHNVYFGGAFTLFTGAVFTDANIKLTIKDYYSLLFSFNIEGAKLIMLIEILKNFFNPFEIHKYFIILAIFISIIKKYYKINFILPLYIVIISQFFLFFFLNPGPRYIWVFWIVSLVISIYTYSNLKIRKI